LGPKLHQQDHHHHRWRGYEACDEQSRNAGWV
jgi:hypothetical protein